MATANSSEASVLDRTDSPTTPATDAAQRRIFRSKVDTIRPTYGFEDVSLAPGTSTVEPADVDLGQTLCGIELAIPVLASAMDAVVDVRLAGELARLGGLAVLNLEGVQARYDDPDAVLARIATAPDSAVQPLLTEPLRLEAIRRLPSGELLYFRDDTHWNAKGIAFAAAPLPSSPSSTA